MKTRTNTNYLFRYNTEGSTMLPIMKRTALPAFLFASVLMSATAARADDTEIYFSSPEGGGEANIVMMLDTSGSMDTNDCVEWNEFSSCVRRN